MKMNEQQESIYNGLKNIEKILLKIVLKKKEQIIYISNLKN